MKRTLLNYWIDAAMLVLMLSMASIGGVLGFVIPRGERFSASQKQSWIVATTRRVRRGGRQAEGAQTS